MRILNNDTGEKIDNITLCLTVDEASELRDTLAEIVMKPEQNHGHLSDFESGKELTVCIYDESNLDPSFHERIKKLIEQDA